MSIEELIEKYLTGNLTSKEEQKLKAWLQDRTNRRVFENIVADWKLTESDVEKSKERVYSRLPGIYYDKKNTQRFISYFSKVAAVFVLVSATVLLIFYNLDKGELSGSNSLQVEKVTRPGQKLTFKLADGTTVMLNSDSRIIFPEHFREAERKVSLEGEAFFEVAKDSLHPFVIKTNELDVRVLGTSFNVRSFDNFNSHKVRRGKFVDRWFAIARDDNGNLIYEGDAPTHEGNNMLGYDRSNGGDRRFYLESAVNYANTFGKHSVTGMLLHNQ